MADTCKAMDCESIEINSNQLCEEHQRKSDAAFEIVCGGVVYKPNGCKMDGSKEKLYRNGCGMCGKGSGKQCEWK